LLSDDFAVCVAVNDLRGNMTRWEKSDWLKTFKKSAIGKALYDTPEFKQLEHLQAELQRHFDLDWPTLRDDILGDAIVLAYSPPTKKQDDEHGLLLLQARNANRLAELVDKLNKAQLKSKELKSLKELEHKGTKYFKRAEPSKTNFYLLDDGFLAFSDKEAPLKSLIERRASPSAETTWTKRFERSGADRAFLSLCVNPRRLDLDLGPAKEGAPLPGFWNALDAVFITASVRDEAELRVTMQADVARLPGWAKSSFTKTSPPSALWQRFPERSLLTVASQMDFAGAAGAIQLMVPPEDRKKFEDEWQRSVGAVIGLDPFKDIFPNLGPDWGFCVLPARNAREVPQAMFAIAVKPGEKDLKVDEGLFKAVQLLASFAIVDHNNKHPDSIIRMQTVMQGKVEVRYLTNDKLFPAGLQPACALKDGYLVFATTPDAIEQFRRYDNKVSGHDTPLGRISTHEFAKVLDQRRDHILAGLTRQNMPEAAAKQNFENVLSFLRLFDGVTISHRGDAGQASWTIRVAPAK
jgi:hypothetical protein